MPMAESSVLGRPRVLSFDQAQNMLPRVCPSDLLVSAVCGPHRACVESPLDTPGRCTARVRRPHAPWLEREPEPQASSGRAARMRKRQAFGKRLAGLCFVVCHHDVRSARPNTPSTDTMQHGQGGVAKGRPCTNGGRYSTQRRLRGPSQPHIAKSRRTRIRSLITGTLLRQ